MNLIRAFLRIIKGIRPADCLLVTVTLTIIPAFYLAEILLVLPILYERWSFWYNFHFVMSLFMLHNIVGNLARGMQGPGNIKNCIANINLPGWKYCDTCDKMSPPRSWHCSICDICVFKRDHHCNFFGCCVGYFNYRYFFMFVAHVFFATAYAMVINTLFFKRHVVITVLNWMSALTFMFPFASLALDWSEENGYIVLLVVNVVFGIFTGYLFLYHVRILIRGKTVGESKHLVEGYDQGWKKNIIDAFGYNWSLVWITPFWPSTLPGDGTHWKKIFD